MKIVPAACGRIKQKVADGTRPSARNAAAIASLSLAHLVKEFSKGELVFGPYDAEERIFEIEEGQVEIFQLSPEGKKVIIDFLAPGNIFANSPFSSNSHVESNDFALARSRIVLRVFKKSDFMSALETSPRLAMRLIREISAKLNEADDRIRDLALSDIKVRLVSELIRFGRRIGKEFDGRIVLGIKLTHEELAEMTGAARETVSRLFGELRQEHVIALDQARHIVIDKEKANSILHSS